MILDHKPDVLCLQKTKIVEVEKLCLFLWGSDDFQYVFKSVERRSGGILMIWRKSMFEMQHSFYGSRFVGISGVWGKEKVQVNILNVYGPCELAMKKDMWEEIVQLKQGQGGNRWCIMGDFNSIKNEERKGKKKHSRHEEMLSFGDFIDKLEVIDLPLVGRKFTWYRDDESSMSRLDRFLVSEEWLESWPNCIQWGLQRGLSDHYAGMLRGKEVNWGPKPFKLHNSWREVEGYKSFVKEQWQNLRVEGRSAFVLKEKLKAMKLKLKEWRQAE